MAAVSHPDPMLIVPYPEGALILVATMYRAMSLTDLLPTCTPAPNAQAGAVYANAESDKVPDGSDSASIVGAPIGSEGPA